MNRIRFLAAGLLCLTGVIHVARLGLADAPALIVVAFGVAYLIIGGLLFLNNKTAYYLGAIAPLIGLCVGAIILTNPAIPVVALLGAIEVAVFIICLYLIKRMRSA